MNYRKILLISNLILILVGTLMPYYGNATISSLAKLSPLPLDKVVHFIIFFGLGINIQRYFQAWNRSFYFLAWAVLLGLFTEVAQDFIPGRGYDLLDLFADTLGVAISIVVRMIYEVSVYLMTYVKWIA